MSGVGCWKPSKICSARARRLVNSGLVATNDSLTLSTFVRYNEGLKKDVAWSSLDSIKLCFQFRPNESKIVCGLLRSWLYVKILREYGRDIHSARKTDPIHKLRASYGEISSALHREITTSTGDHNINKKSNCRRKSIKHGIMPSSRIQRRGFFKTKCSFVL